MTDEYEEKIIITEPVLVLDSVEAKIIDSALDDFPHSMGFPCFGQGERGVEETLLLPGPKSEDNDAIDAEFTVIDEWHGDPSYDGTD